MFWKKFCKNLEPFVKSNYQTNPVNNMIYFLECLASCHSIDKLKNEILGNTVDKKIYEKLNWVMEKIDKNSFKNSSESRII